LGAVEVGGAGGTVGWAEADYYGRVCEDDEGTCAAIAVSRVGQSDYFRSIGMQDTLINDLNAGGQDTDLSLVQRQPANADIIERTSDAAVVDRTHDDGQPQVDSEVRGKVIQVYLETIVSSLVEEEAIGGEERIRRGVSASIELE
jgi:hypothetical protein